MSNAKEEAVRIKAHAHEEAEKQIADARTQAERVLTLSQTGFFYLLQGNWS
jgi:F0F1-type ATP synthase membrane subunit b/b'